MLGNSPAQQLRMIRSRRRFWFLLHRGTSFFRARFDFVAQIARLVSRLRRPGSSSDPYAYVAVPKKPLFPRHSASIALSEPD
jgi:hypothetical protein